MEKNTGARELPPLKVGTDVVIQSQDRKKRWNKFGRIVEVLPHRQYRVKLSQSGRVTLQNRRFIREYTNITAPAITPYIILSQDILPSQDIPPSQADTTQLETARSTSTASPSENTPPATIQQQPSAKELNASADTFTPRVPRVPRALKNLEEFLTAGKKW